MISKHDFESALVALNDRSAVRYTLASHRGIAGKRRGPMTAFSAVGADMMMSVINVIFLYNSEELIHPPI